MTVASVDSYGVVKALKAGETTITIRAAQTADYQAATSSYKLTDSHKYTGDWKKDDTGYYKDCVCGDKSYATEVPVLGVALDKTSMNLTAGSTGTLIATITPENAKSKSLAWTSDKEAVATVDENGKVTAVAEGIAKITVTTVDGKKTAVCAVTVTAKSSGGGATGGGSSSGGGGGGSSSSSKPSTSTGTTTRPDGTKVQTETRADGTRIQTETKKDGSTVKTTTNPNGSSVTETKAADGSTGTVKTDKNGQTTAETALSSKAIEDAKKSGEPVKAPVEVAASRESSTAPTVRVR